MKTEFSTFEEALYLDSKQAFKQILADSGDDIYVMGFYHSGSFSFLPMFNTLADFQSTFENDYHCKEDDRLLVKWNVNDFASLEDYSEYFTNSTEILHAFDNDHNYYIASDEEIKASWDAWLSTLERVLIRLDNEGIFSDGVKRNLITLAILAYDETEEEQFSRIKRMNPSAVITTIQTDFETLIASRNEAEQLAMEEFERTLKAR